MDVELKWRLTLMAGKWYANSYTDLQFEVDAIEDHTENGMIICLSDDLERFCSEMKVELDTIIMVDDEEEGT